MNDKSLMSEPIAADALALGESGKSPETAKHAARYLDEQLKLQREHAQREAALHDLHVENLKLQSNALRAQHQQLRSQRLHDRFRTIYQTVLSVIALAVLCAIVYAVVSAARDQSVVVNQFQVPPSFAAQGNNGTVVAGAFLDRLNTLQATARTSSAAPALQDAWSNNIRIQVPDVHVSLGDIRRTLHQSLGHEIQINGDLIEQGEQIALTVRGTGFAAKTFTGTPDSLPTLINNAADYVYGEAEPYFYAAYLEESGQNAQALQLVQAIFPTASAKERPWLLNAWGNALSGLNQNAAAVDKFREAIRLDPHFWIAYDALENAQIDLGEEETAYQNGASFERQTRRGHWFAARIPVIWYGNLDSLLEDLPAEHQENLVDEAAHGGVGSLMTQDAPLDALVLANMHADRQALATLQTASGGSSDHSVMSGTDAVDGVIALNQQNYSQAASAYEAEQALYAQYPELGPFNDTDAGRLALAEELSGHPDKADAAIVTCGHYVDCHWYAGDIAAQRGDWAKAEQEYAAAVALAPDLPDGYQGWGLALLRHKDYANAILKFQQANQRSPHWCDPLKYWGDALAAQGNYKAAIQKYAEAAKYTPGWGALELVWGQALGKLGDHKEALTHYQSAKNNTESLTGAEQTTLATVLKQTG